ncbi:MAG TPA: hypothetical protein VHT27_13565 [Solirubrobacteraceae bacterium]|jgi:hypothetical protein|nr:hypothetical protein [Solirubrobacteraceae bacterium]
MGQNGPLPEPTREPDSAERRRARPGHPPWWAAAWPRQGALALCLLLAIGALLENRGVFSSSVAHAQAPPSCEGRVAPAALPLDRREAGRLRTIVRAVFDGRGGRLYESGRIDTSNLWTDNDPNAGAGGGYEARWWALEPEGRQDDVVVDALPYPSSTDARAALALAANPRCHRDGSGGGGAFPAGSRKLTWVNPDAAYEHDTMLVRGSLLYRVAVVPPGESEGPAGAAQWVRDRERVALLTDALACSLPSAGCGATPLAAAIASAGPPAAQPDPTSQWPRSRAAAARYLRAVAIRPFDFAWMRVYAPARSTQSAQGCERALAMARGPHATSQALAYRRGLTRWSAISYDALLSSDAAAARVISSYRAAVRAGCIQRELDSSVAHHNARDRRLRYEEPRVSLPPTPAPESLTRGTPYRAVALRVSMQIVYRTQRGRTLRLPFFEQATAIAYRRLVVTFLTESTREPLSEDTREYIESVLLGRAEANWGLPPA